MELSAITVHTWSYRDDVFWNPVLFHWLSYPVTLGIQVVWVAAPVGFALLGKRMGAH